MQPQPDTTHHPSASARSDQAHLGNSLRLALVDEIECGLIVCDELGAVRFANHAAQLELDSARLLRRVGNSLVCAASTGSALDNALRQAARKGRRQMVALTQGNDRLMVSAVPLRLPDFTERFVLVVLGRRRPCSDLGLEMLANVYGLSLAERRVMAGLINEATPRDIAEANSVSLATVRSQIQAVRLKLGARNVEAVLIRAAEVPPVPSALRLTGGAGAHGNARALALPSAA